MTKKIIAGVAVVMIALVFTAAPSNAAKRVAVTSFGPELCCAVV